MLSEEEKAKHLKESRAKYAKETGYAAQKKYREEHKDEMNKALAEYNKTKTKLLNIRFILGDEDGNGRNEDDARIWEHLSKQENKSGYIKRLILADIDKNKETPTD